VIGPVEPVFAPPAPEQRLGAADLSESAMGVESELSGFFHAFVPDLEQAQEAQRLLQRELGVEAQIEARPTAQFVSDPEPVFGSVAAAAGGPPNLIESQRYLLPKPHGIDAVFSWRVHGGNGLNINIVDLEWGWNFRHVDLQERSAGQVIGSPPPANLPRFFIDHGTAVLGVMSADALPAGVGMIGIAHGATVAGASPALPDGRWNVEQAIRSSVELMNPGHVLLLELQTADRFPYEALASVFSVLQWATLERGIYVVEVAGNAGNNNVPLDSIGITRTRDSGAILVGAGGSSVGPFPRARVSHSNFGSRVDLQGWGERVATCGGRSSPEFFDLHPDPSAERCYTGSFRETSSAAAMVAGVVACIAGVVRATGRPPLKPADMRDLLVTTGQAQTNGPNPPGQNIGPLPDLRAALIGLGVPPT
jgi:serine protease